jgi:hypothetical protein
MSALPPGIKPPVFATPAAPSVTKLGFTPPAVPVGAMSTQSDKPLQNLDAPQSVRLKKDGSANPEALPSVLIIGEQGSGKSHAIRSLLDSGFSKVVVIALEPGIQDVLGDIQKGKLAWKYINPYGLKMGQLASMYKTMHTMPLTALQGLGHMGREKFPQFIDLMAACDSFVDDRTGENLGGVENFPTDWAFVIDGLSGLNIMVQHFTIGVKPFLELRDYQAIQNSIIEFLNTLTNDSKCLFVLNAHLERETDENTGQSVLTMSTIGKKLAPKLGRFFSDVILTERYTKDSKQAWRWVTDSSQIRLKARNLPYSKELPASFKPLLDSWRAKQVLSTKV